MTRCPDMKARRSLPVKVWRSSGHCEVREVTTCVTPALLTMLGLVLMMSTSLGTSRNTASVSTYCGRELTHSMEAEVIISGFQHGGQEDEDVRRNTARSRPISSP